MRVHPKCIRRCVGWRMLGTTFNFQLSLYTPTPTLLVQRLATIGPSLTQIIVTEVIIIFLFILCSQSDNKVGVGVY